jgi:hypothetical protein
LDPRAEWSDPNPEISRFKREFTKERSIHPYQSAPRGRVDPEEASALAGEYDQLPTDSLLSDPRRKILEESYRHLRLWIRRQFGALQRAGYSMEPYHGQGEPYANSSRMREDVRRNRHLWVFAGGDQQGSHPFLPPEDNFRFRAVHDILAHAGPGSSFGPEGEYDAWLTHARTLPEAAHLALEMETVRQNMWTNYGPHMRQNPSMPLPERPFVDKVPVVAPEMRPRRFSSRVARVGTAMIRSRV